jgi:peptide/nickel transport system substrate-binding protein
VDRSDEGQTPTSADAMGRRRFLRTVAGAGAVAGSGGLLAACGSGGQKPASAAAGLKRRGGSLKVGMTGGSSSDTIDPNKPVVDLDISRVMSLYEPLVANNNQASGVNYVLAESITPYNGSVSDWVIRLRPGIAFHDGSPLTSADVLFTFKRIYNGDLPGKIFLGPIDLPATRALDNRTVLVKLTAPFATYIEQLAAAPYNLLIAPTTLNPARPNGTGPFRYQSFTPGQRSVFTRNPHYWQHGLPYVDTLTIIDFSDTVSLQNALETGVVQGAGTLDYNQLPALRTAAGVVPVISKAGSIVPFTMRVDRPPFNDVRVRQAMRYIVNRPNLIDAALDGLAAPASDVFSPYDPDFDSSLHRVQDIPYAKALLKQAGQEGLKVTLTTSPILSSTVAMATVFAEQAKAANVTVALSNVPSGTFFGPNYLQWAFAQDYYQYSPYLTQVAQSMLPTSPYNETHNDNPHYTSLYNQANAAADLGLRKEIIHEMQLIDFDQGGYIIPAFTDSLDAYSSKITGYSQCRLGIPLSNYDFMHFAFTG